MKKLVKTDRIMRKGFNFRRVMYLAGVADFLTILIGIPFAPSDYAWIVVMVVVALSIITFSCYMLFKRWEKANAVHLRGLGFTIK